MINRNSLAEKFKTAINKCEICYSEYNRYDKKPVIICTGHHTICRECMTGLQISRKCPFCRQNINFGKVVVNNYIFELLPNDPPPPNYRAQANLVPFHQPQHRIVQQNPNNINYVPVQPIYPNNYQPQVNYIEPFQQYLYEERAFDTSDCIGSIRHRLGLEAHPDRMVIYFIIFVLQLPYLIFDWYFSQTGSDKKCYDTPYVTRAYVLRSWLLAMGITQAVIMGILFLGACIRICKLITVGCLQCVQYIVLALLVIKVLLWTYMEIALFSAVIVEHCSGGVYAYGIIQTIIHGIFILIMCCLSICK